MIAEVYTPRLLILYGIIILFAVRLINFLIIKKNNKYFNFKNITLILGVLGDKQVDEMVEEITRGVDKVVIVEPHSDRAEDIEDLYIKVKKYVKEVFKFKDYKEAYNKAYSLTNEDDLLLICGSLYMVGDMRKAIRNNENTSLRSIKY